MTGKILITPRSLSKGGHPELKPLEDKGFKLIYPNPGATPSEADLIAAIYDCSGWLAGVEPVSKNVIEVAVDLRGISRNGTGIDNLPMAEVKERQIAVKRAVGTNARGVAELALALTLAGMRYIIPSSAGVKAGEWPRKIGREIQNSEIAVIGLGAIGSAFAEFALMLGANVRGYDPFAPIGDRVHQNFLRTDLEEAFNGANAVSLHAPRTRDGTSLIGTEDLARLAPGAVVVNTARASLVEPSAMLEALENGQVATYATDAFETEPPELDDLLSHPNVVLTSHIGGFTQESVERTTKVAVDNILEVLNSDAT